MKMYTLSCEALLSLISITLVTKIYRVVLGYGVYRVDSDIGQYTALTVSRMLIMEAKISQREPDLDSLHGDPRFRPTKIMAKALNLISCLSTA